MNGGASRCRDCDSKTFNMKTEQRSYIGNREQRKLDIINIVARASCAMTHATQSKKRNLHKTPLPHILDVPLFQEKKRTSRVPFRREHNEAHWYNAFFIHSYNNI